MLFRIARLITAARLGIRAASESTDDPQEIIEIAYEEAKNVMESMIVNPGQETVLQDYFLPEFENQIILVEPPDTWTDISCKPYCSFMSETVEAGNQIMRQGYSAARKAYIKQFIGVIF